MLHLSTKMWDSATHPLLCSWVAFLGRIRRFSILEILRVCKHVRPCLPRRRPRLSWPRCNVRNYTDSCELKASDFWIGSDKDVRWTSHFYTFFTFLVFSRFCPTKTLLITVNQRSTSFVMSLPQIGPAMKTWSDWRTCAARCTSSKGRGWRADALKTDTNSNWLQWLGHAHSDTNMSELTGDSFLILQIRWR